MEGCPFRATGMVGWRWLSPAGRLGKASLPSADAALPVGGDGAVGHAGHDPGEVLVPDDGVDDGAAAMGAGLFQLEDGEVVGVGPGADGGDVRDGGADEFAFPDFDEVISIDEHGPGAEAEPSHVEERKEGQGREDEERELRPEVRHGQEGGDEQAGSGKAEETEQF